MESRDAAKIERGKIVKILFLRIVDLTSIPRGVSKETGGDVGFTFIFRGGTFAFSRNCFGLVRVLLIYRLDSFCGRRAKRKRGKVKLPPPTPYDFSLF